MFGARKKNADQSRQQRPGGRTLAQMGLMDMDNVNDDDNDDLEDELNKLMFGGSKATKKRKNKDETVDLEAMVASCMRDLPSDESGDEDDPDLLDELNDLGSSEDEDVSHKSNVANPPLQQNLKQCHSEDACAGQDLVSLIDSRISMYSCAEQQAKMSGDSAKARRFNRALTTLTDLRRKANSGKAVDPDEIPPALSTLQSTLKSAVETPSVKPLNIMGQSSSSVGLQQNVVAIGERAEIIAPIKTSQEKSELDHFISNLKQKREQYKELALSGKRDGNKSLAMAGLQAVKQCDQMLLDANNGKIVSLDELPVIPNGEVSVEEQSVQKSPNPSYVRAFSRDDPIQMPENIEDIPPPDPALFGAPPAPSTIEEALQQRLEKYKQDEAKAKQEGNTSRARRIGRICQQYQDAMKLHRAGKPIPVDDLPSPPGFGPIPVNKPSTALSPPKPSGTMSTQSSGSSIAPVSPKPASASVSPSQQPSSNSQSAEKPTKKLMTLQEKQLLLLEKRQELFKQAALEAKKSGQLEQAKEYLRQFKGFDKLIEATKCGLPVDLNSLPVPPQNVKNVNLGFVIVAKEDCGPEILSSEGGDRQDMYKKLEEGLLGQIKMCETNQNYFKVTGDVPSSNKFQQMMEHTKKDLDALRFSFKRGDPVPKFRYETRAFSRVFCNTELSDNECEMTLVQGINFSGPNPKEMQTYCRIEFPYPKETPFVEKTPWVKNTNSPVYNFKVIIPLNRKEKSCQRVFKRGIAKVEVWAKGGFLRSDLLVGTALIKLQNLETLCDVHDTFALMDGRRAVGGQVEVKIRLRNPIVTKQIEKVEEKWLVITF